ncbi:hypothetical protein RQM65_06165 [Pricia sp. S334]|uniref:Baseplate protein J-like domain-containing protein n=1 Tax=Pricia mediterranea TaxID=3076079 RepID=A0ABU3L488_9FLAO|nr:hypothetical protein [Pricia sp. S334]MDT7828242.1 hypothetical protein [Pricia sp. S334]
MQQASKIAHPLKHRTGTSQRTRVIDALAPESAPIDGKTLADRLYLIGEYARYINFYTHIDDPVAGEYQQLDSWTSFFADSLPFQLAKLAKVPTDDLERRFQALYGGLQADPTQQSLESLLRFIDDRLLTPVDTLYHTVAAVKNSFTVPLLATLKSSFVEPAKRYIALHNASATFLCTGKGQFTAYLSPPWQLEVNEVYALDRRIQQVRHGKREAFMIAAETLNILFHQMLNGFGEIVEAAPGYIEESLRPLEAELRQSHEAHLALLFTFLELFRYFQGNINELGKKHLDFFYQQVLRMAPREAVPDQAHIVFEVAKHLEAYPLPECLLLKDGKDANKKDIVFGLDQEIVLDKAQVKDLRTLALPTVTGADNTYLEGVYMAPMANSLDGQGKEFSDDEPTNWSTLGSKYSKYVGEGSPVVQEHPKARIGFVLSSPVLLLQEGRREIKIRLTCELPSDIGFTGSDIENAINALQAQKWYTLTKDLLEDCGDTLSEGAKAHLEALLAEEHPFIIGEDLRSFLFQKDPISCRPMFGQGDRAVLCRCLDENATTPGGSFLSVSLSGEKDWVRPNPDNPVDISVSSSSASEVVLELEVTLEAEDPPVVFFDPEKLKEEIEIGRNLPAVKIELDKEARIKRNAFDCDDLDKPDTPVRPDCCLEKPPVRHQERYVSLYHYFRELRLGDAQIEVDVCGVKNLIVQNDEGVLDPNSQIHPFGIRPEVPGFDPMNQVDLGAPADPVTNPELFLGPSFYIGSKEILYKKWEAVRVNMEWKEKPHDFHDYYKAYLKHEADTNDPPAGEHFGLFEGDFKVKIDLLDTGTWAHLDKMELFSEPDLADLEFQDLDCDVTQYAWQFTNGLTDRFIDYDQPIDLFKNSQNGFLKFTLADQDFLHKEYAFVLARQMLAYSYAGTGENKKLADAIYVDDSSKIVISPIVDFLNEDEIIEAVSDLTGDLITAVRGVFQFIEDNEAALKGDIAAVKEDIEDAKTALDNDLTQYFNDVVGAILDFAASFPAKQGEIITALNNIAIGSAQTAIDNLNLFLTDLKAHFTDPDGIDALIVEVEQAFEDFDNLLDDTGIFNFLYGSGFQALIPKEPWTPIIKNLFLDYSAKAIREDIAITHLYPFENTSKGEDIEQVPTLFPYFDDEGTLFIGLEALTPGGNLSLLFQLAEATADSEQDRAHIDWHYLTGNTWVQLLPDFDVIDDGTDGLTVSGIVTIAVPDAIDDIGTTVMPAGLYWIKVSAAENVRAVAETIGVHAQAAKASARLDDANDTGRLETALEAGSITKLREGDFSVKKVGQPYASFGGRKPEAEGHFYTRVSEHLKHKGRGLMIGDYEKTVLEGFSEIYKVKCISHTMGLSANSYRRDLEVAPGFVVVAVIPDLTKLKAGNQLEPKAPLSLLEKIGDHLRKRISPFARLKIMNPRYEPVDVCVSVRLYRGKSESFYAKKLQDDLVAFLAPWFLGDTEKLAFGEEVLFSDVVGFIEGLEYVDFIADLKLEGPCEQTGSRIRPLTARSVLTAGKICVGIDREKCSEPSVGNGISTELI